MGRFYPSLPLCIGLLTASFFFAVDAFANGPGDPPIGVCHPDHLPGNPITDFIWMELLGKRIEREEVVIPYAYPRPSPSPSPSPTPPNYDLPEDKLKKLREAAHWAAEKCRTVTNRETKVKERICGDKSKGYCLAGVKDALLKAGFTSTRIGPTIAFARDMHKKETLKDEGFKDIMPEGFTSETAPEGAILVYSGGIRTGCPKGGCGHIEIKLGPKEYCSDFCSTRPVDAYMNRKLIGVYVKPTK